MGSLSSSRPGAGSRPRVNPLARWGLTPPAIVLNGALALDLATDERFHRHHYDADVAARVLDAFRAAGLDPCVYVEHDDIEVYVGARPSTNPGHLASFGTRAVTADLDEIVATAPVLGFGVIGHPLEPLDGRRRHHRRPRRDAPLRRLAVGRRHAHRRATGALEVGRCPRLLRARGPRLRTRARDRRRAQRSWSCSPTRRSPSSPRTRSPTRSLSPTTWFPHPTPAAGPTSSTSSDPHDPLPACLPRRSPTRGPSSRGACRGTRRSLPERHRRPRSRP